MDISILIILYKLVLSQQTEVDDTTSCYLGVLNSTSKLLFNSTLTPLLNSTYQMGEIWEHKLDLNSTFWIPVFTTRISPKYHPDNTHWTSIFKTSLLGENSRFNPDMARLLQVKTPLLEGKSRVLLEFYSSFCLLGWSYLSSALSFLSSCRIWFTQVHKKRNPF